MKHDQPIDALTALGHPGRLAVFRLLARRAPHGVRPAEIIGALGLKPSTLSVYLAALDRAGLIDARRDGKSIYYSLTLGEVAALVDFLVNDCCHGRPELCAPLAARALRALPGSEHGAPDRPFDVLFLCIGNSARSILAEAILREIGGGRFRGFSAGTAPRSEPSPLALEVLSRQGHDLSGLRSKSVAEFREPAAPRFDFVFTLCDAAANEECPAWPGQPLAARPTGDFVFNAPSSMLFAPVVTVPLMSVGGMPVGVQVMGQQQEDARLTGIARWLHGAVRPVVG